MILTKSPTHRNSIGALRFALAALVLYTHAFPLGGFGAEPLSTWSGSTMIAGTFAVQAFFVLSGALVTASWVRLNSPARFIWHRFLRIVPGFWTCLIVTAFVLTPVLWLTSPEPRPLFFSMDPSSAGYVWHNLLRPRAQIAIGQFPNGGPYGGDWNGSLWTLFYECACYLMVAALGLAGLFGRARRTGTTMLLAVLVLYTCWEAFHSVRLLQPFDRLFDTPGKRLTMYFLAGSVWSQLPGMTAPLLRSRWIGPLSCALLLASWHWEFHSWSGVWIVPIVLFWLARILPLANFESWVGGDYSYGIYIYGYPLEQTLAHFRIHEAGFTVFLLISFLATGIFAAASWHGVERSALMLKNIFAAPVRLDRPNGVSPSVASNSSPL